MILRIKSSHPFSIIQFNAGFIWLSKKIDFDFIDFRTNLHLTSIYKRNKTDFIVLETVVDDNARCDVNKVAGSCWENDKKYSKV